MRKITKSANYPVKHQLSQAGFSFEVYSSVSDLPLDWEKATFEQNVFLQRPYLTAVENAPPFGLEFNYLIIYKDLNPIGRAVFQITKFDASSSVQDLHHDPSRHSIWWRIGQYFKKIIARWAKFNLLVCGNSLLTGEHGFDYDKSIIDRISWIKIIEESSVLISQYLGETGLKIDGIFIKDLEGGKSIDGATLEKLKFHEFVFHPSMVMDISWDNFDEYLAAISSKYRVRAKRAFKKAKAIERIELTSENFESLNPAIYQLYQNVANQASFNMVSLGEDYFYELKRQLGDQFRIFGYYQEGELVGFYTTIDNDHEIEAHFLGMNGPVNRKTQLYLNMLFDMIRQSIDSGKNKLVLARTAMEIKSSVGAVPKEMFGYIRANRSWINYLMPKVLELLRPKDDWLPRRPFKDPK